MQAINTGLNAFVRACEIFAWHFSYNAPLSRTGLCTRFTFSIDNTYVRPETSTVYLFSSFLLFLFVNRFIYCVWKLILSIRIECEIAFRWCSETASTFRTPHMRVVLRFVCSASFELQTCSRDQISLFADECLKFYICASPQNLPIHIFLYVKINFQWIQNHII